MSSDEQAHAYARWVDNMSAIGRRAATSVAASKGRQWVNRTLEDRPTRGEVRAWFELVLDERRGLHNRVEALTKENEALAAQRDEALETAAEYRDRLVRPGELRAQVRALTAQQAEALAGYREDVERFRAHVEILDADRARRTKERDEALDALSLVRETVARQLGRYEELRGAYDQAEGERNELARRVGVGRASCPHTSRGGAE